MAVIAANLNAGVILEATVYTALVSLPLLPPGASTSSETTWC